VSKRITLTDNDIVLLVKLLKDADYGIGFKRVATQQRVDSILAKLEPPTAIKLRGSYEN